MDNLFIVAATTAVIWYLRNVFFWVSLWQSKEYRLDRMFLYLFETSQGRQLLFSPIALVKWLGVVLYIVVIFEEQYLFYFHIFITCVFVIEAVRVLQSLSTKEYSYPEVTLKALSLVISSVLTVLLLLAIPLLDKYFWLLFLDKILFFVVGFFVFLHSFPTELYRDMQINSAMRKLRNHKDLMVIGISGSYGKSLTREFIVQVLSKKFSVVATEHNKHTMGGIAEVILKKISAKTQVFVVEMGAYGTNEIAQICYIVKPNIGILTGINTQHLSLFKSLKKSTDAKKELIDALPKNGIALFNGNDSAVEMVYQKTKIQKILYGVSDSGSGRVFDVQADLLRKDKSAVGFVVSLHDQQLQMKAPLLGGKIVVNLLPALYIADFFGMTQQEIKSAVASLTPLPSVMAKRTTKTGIVVLDDTSNANPESIAAIVDYLHLYKKKKYFIYQPTIELGKDARKHHVAVGKHIASQCDYLLLTNKNYSQSIKNGVAEDGGSCEVIVGSAHAITKFILRTAVRGDIVVGIGREAKRILRNIT